jgi:Uma2 family endonuclease
MTAQTTSFLDAIEHLPAGGTLILTDVSWEEYEQLLADLGDSNAVRVSYDRGRLEIMSPSSFHEMYKDLVLQLACIIAEEMDLVLETRGSTTFKQKEFAQGAEPDTCFYVQNAHRIIGKRQIDLSTDPPPDVIVEIDVTHGSQHKLAFYAALGVPEIWRYDEQRAQIYHLTEKGYVEMVASRVFTLLTGDALSRFLEQSKSEGQSATLRSFREWLRTEQQKKA